MVVTLKALVAETLGKFEKYSKLAQDPDHDGRYVAVDSDLVENAEQKLIGGEVKWSKMSQEQRKGSQEFSDAVDALVRNQQPEKP